MSAKPAATLGVENLDDRVLLSADPLGSLQSYISSQLSSLAVQIGKQLVYPVQASFNPYQSVQGLVPGYLLPLFKQITFGPEGTAAPGRTTPTSFDQLLGQLDRSLTGRPLSTGTAYLQGFYSNPIGLVSPPPVVKPAPIGYQPGPFGYSGPMWGIPVQSPPINPSPGLLGGFGLGSLLTSR